MGKQEKKRTSKDFYKIRSYKHRKAGGTYRVVRVKKKKKPKREKLI